MGGWGSCADWNDWKVDRRVIGEDDATRICSDQHVRVFCSDKVFLVPCRARILVSTPQHRLMT